MVLDISLFRSPETLAIIRKSHLQRYGVDEDIEDIISHDNEVRKLTFSISKHAQLENMIKRIVGIRIKSIKKEKENIVQNDICEDLTFNSEKNDKHYVCENVLLSEKLINDIPHLEKPILEQLSIDELIKVSKITRDSRLDSTNILDLHENARKMLLSKIGNILHESVPFGPNDDSNIICFTHNVTSERLNPKKLLPHYELIKMIDGVDTKAGSKIAGNRGYYLKGPCVYLAQALQQFALSLLDEQDFVAIQTPYFMNEDIMASVAQLSQFDEELYKVVCTNNDDGNDNTTTTKYLIATSEQPLTALHSGEKISIHKLPIKYAGTSTCFRKEAGRHGKDASGIFRVHQFEKIEQFIICSSENGESWRQLDEILKNATHMLDVLNIPYRVVNIASGELNHAASKKYDIEGLFPSNNTYRELVSCSNCTDYHSRNLNIKHTSKMDKDGRYVHMLNSTMCAVTRMICVILENYQSDEGIIVPLALQKYMPKRYCEIIPYV
jgi:seryl-tRNA synthetase